jgi:hypothetical protein
MSDIAVQAGDLITIGASAAVLQVIQANGIQPGDFPFAVEFRLPMQNLDKAWYEYAASQGSYAGHPPARDWNLESLGNTDLGEPLVAPWTGIVITAANIGGKVGRVVQLLGLTPEGEVLVWAGWHMEDVVVKVGQIVHVGSAIGTIGNAGGIYSAHLHEQIARIGGKKYYGIPSPATFTTDTRYEWLDPLEFYPARGVDADLVRRVSRFDKE